MDFAGLHRHLRKAQNKFSARELVQCATQSRAEAISLLMPMTAEQVNKLKLAAFSYPEKVIVIQQYTKLGERWHKVFKGIQKFAPKN